MTRVVRWANKSWSENPYFVVALLHLLLAASDFPILCPSWQAQAQTQAQDMIVYENCALGDYYADLLLDNDNDGTAVRLRDDVTRDQLESLLATTHRNVLPYTSDNRDDVWKALMDLDRGNSSTTTSSSSTEGTVRLVYRQVDVPAEPHGTAETWNREHLWPKSHGVEYTGADFTDVHHLRPSDWNVNARRNNLYFGTCGFVQPLEECVQPAHEEAAPDTAADKIIFTPPAIVRGDIARAIFYMDVRYSASTNDGMDLVLTDCPSLNDDNDDAPNNEMAYKSILLEWHLADPVSEEERQRNQRACERWQGNRNVFVDFPELVEQIFGVPQSPLGEGLGYPGCGNENNNNNNNNNVDDSNNQPAPAPAPTTTTITTIASNQCENLAPGDILFVAVTSSTPEVVALVTLADLQEGLVLFLTDNAWSGSTFRDNEGTLSFRVPSEGISAGTVIGYGASSDVTFSEEWESEGGQFQLSTMGDTVLLYCQPSTDSSASDRANDDIRWLSAFDFSGNGWMESGLDESVYGTSSSALPDELDPKGAISLPHFDNYFYTGPTEGHISELHSYLVDPQNWQTNNDANSGSVPIPASFSLTSSSSSPIASPSLSAGSVMVTALFSSDPDLVALVALDNLPGNLPLYLTDNAWTGTGFRTNEGTLLLNVPNSGIPAGTIFGYGPGVLYGNNWLSAGGRFALAEAGDTVTVNTQNNGGEEIVHLGAFTYTGTDSWAPTGLLDSEYDTDQSALPGSLQSVGAISLPHNANYVYTGPTRGDKAFLQSSLQNQSNWEQSQVLVVPLDSFSVRSTTMPTSSSRDGVHVTGAIWLLFMVLAVQLAYAIR